ncbi:hypothetical protein [Phenylobacterium sp. J367]|uniref:hypothetical protein n=1 Tax=Phenylobacterium sp. J367 TaxID=2898435 RepID=UPI002151CF62|nr:hypothetical protein [Phenylobacterium sp. J367]MCR5877462.1 hypothetical protein [Phenylobacterium sp. J367]
MRWRWSSGFPASPSTRATTSADLEGAAGNVLIDGQRPAAKSDGLGEILNRIPAGSVERIDLIRGGAPGIDMQGKTVLVNVVRKSGGGFRGLIAASGKLSADTGIIAPAFRLEGSGGSNGRNWEAGALIAQGFDDGAGGRSPRPPRRQRAGDRPVLRGIGRRRHLPGRVHRSLRDALRRRPPAAQQPDPARRVQLR